jgi:fructose-specific component phosphotransferase system IIB-like protein
MTRSHLSLLLALAIAGPALATAAISQLPGKNSPCFSIGGNEYRLSQGAVDYTVKIDNAATRPDLVVQIVDNPATADFVLVDGAENFGACSDTRAIRTIRIDPQASDPDLTIALASTTGAVDYKIYAQSAEFSQQDAAALFAVMSKAGRKRDLAAR